MENMVNVRLTPKKGNSAKAMRVKQDIAVPIKSSLTEEHINFTVCKK
jgi:hypothetical protein